MKLDSTSISDAKIVTTSRFYDQRGYFNELYSSRELGFPCVQVNLSRSNKNVIRGLHVVPFSKLIYCVQGRIFDVVVDVREDSVTYLKWYGMELSEETPKALYIPKNCGHGFLALEESIVVYMQDGLYDPKSEIIINAFDPKLNIKWPITEVIMSDKDKLASNWR
jgi:dTDP-4-dehydrorhamnose 3,5-epimerase